MSRDKTYLSTLSQAWHGIGRCGVVVVFAAVILLVVAVSSGAQRFAPPEFESGYAIPPVEVPPMRAVVYEYIDAAVLLVCLAAACVFIHRFRRRWAILLLTIFCLLYFGWWRKGCVCSVGSVQNVVFSFFDSEYVIPLGVLIFFLLPMVFTLFFGRVFCGAVCPLGAVQDVVLIRPMKVWAGLESVLRLAGYLYLGLAVLFAATGSAFIICRYDPFVSFFRFGGNLYLWVTGFSFIVVGVFVGRPYCRFFCPYGMILRQLGRLARRPVTITPDECIKCRLCGESCPFGAINAPTLPWPKRDYQPGRKRLILFIALVPVIAIVGAAAGFVSGGALSRVNDTVRLAERVYLEGQGSVIGTTDQSSAFYGSGQDTQSLYRQGQVIRDRFGVGATAVGLFVGFVGALKLVSHSIRRRRDIYEADTAGCFACGRCFGWCPRERLRRRGGKSL